MTAPVELNTSRLLAEECRRKQRLVIRKYRQGFRLMDSNRGRLRAALVAGRIQPTDKNLSTLIKGLSTIAQGYHIERVISSEAKTRAELRKELLQLHTAFRTAIGILEADISGTSQIEVLFFNPWAGNGIREFLEELRSYFFYIEMLLTMLAQNRAIGKRRQNPATGFFVAVYDLFATLTGEAQPGIAGPLHRFTKHCAALTDPKIKVPEGGNSFRKRLTTALGRRTGKIEVNSRRVVTGKIVPPI